MCNLCSDNQKEVQAEQKRLYHIADNLTRLSMKYVRMAQGRTDPHSEDAKQIANLSRIIIRELVEEWV